jgi:hypothetical protein
VSPLTSRALRGQAPRRRYVVATQPMARPAQALKARRYAQDVEWQGQPGLEPGRSLAVAAGLLGPSPSKHNGLLHEVWPVVRKLTLCPHRCGCRLAPFGFKQPPLCLAPLRPCTRHQLAARAAPNTKACVGHGFAIATGDHSQALRAVLMVGPARPPSAPEGLPIALASPITSTKGEDHHARANHHRRHA